MRQVTNARRDALCCFQGSREPLRAVDRQLVGTEPIELDGQHRELLIDVVVQFPGDAGALRLLFAEQPSTQMTDSVVTHAQPGLAATQLALAAAQFALDLLPPGSLNEQAGDKSGLRHYQHDRADDVALVLVPHARRSKEDAGTRWHTRLVE